MTNHVVEPYQHEVTGGKGSIFYRTHSYHTKVPPEGIVPLIKHYTRPGDVVLDPFCGSGMTGVACLLSGRNAVLSDLSPAAVHIARGHTARPDIIALDSAARKLMRDLAELERTLYGTTCAHCAEEARIEYTVWSDTLACPRCRKVILFWDAARRPDGTVAKVLRCPECSQTFRKADADIGPASPVLVSVACHGCRTREQRPLTDVEKTVALHPHRLDIEDWYPTTPLEAWREMWRGQHRDLGIETAADFFTGRNLRALAAIWKQASASSEPTEMRFAATAMINRASRRYQWNPKRPTNVLTGTLYIASLTYEFNVFSLLRRKLRAVRQLAVALNTTRGTCSISQTSASTLSQIPDQGIDYVFTDPPFGSNIYYSDASFLWEAWLDHFTHTEEEAVVSTSLALDKGGKTLQDYEKLMAASFSEITRVLRPGGWVSVMFHNSDDAVWSALVRAIESADLKLEGAIAFDKTQPSFKGVKQVTDRERVPSFDLVLHLRLRPPMEPRRQVLSDFAERANVIHRAVVDHLAAAPRNKRTTPYLHSFIMRLLLQRGWPMDGYSYRDVEELLTRDFVGVDGAWTAPQPAPSEPVSNQSGGVDDANY